MTATPRYVLFMRHARHGPESRNGERVGKAHEVNQTGQEQTRSVAERLREQLSEAREGIKLTAILHASSGEAIGTAEIVQWELKTGRQHPIRIPLEGLEPAHAFKCQTYKQKEGDPPRPDSLGRHLKACVENQVRSDVSAGNAILVIGHQPVLGWVAHAFTGDSPPLIHSEVVCYDLERSPPGAPIWAISPEDKTTLEDLREKIRKKMELAGVFGGFITAGISFLIGMLAKPANILALETHPGMMFLALGCLFLAVVFYLFTMFSYDSLLMPRRFWSETPSGMAARPRWVVARPPSAAHWVLYQNMIHVWQWQFIPATVLALYGLYLLGGAVLLGYAHSQDAPTVFAYAVTWIPVVLLALMMLFGSAPRLRWKTVRQDLQALRNCPGLAARLHYIFGPWLGSED